jgi:hypothetical protein
MAEAIVGETTQVHGKELGKGDGATMSLDSELNHNVITMVDAHILLLQFLLADMQHMVLGVPTSGKCEDSKKRLKNFVNETMPMTLEFEGDLPMNEVTWFELVHHTWSLLLKLKKSGNLTGLRPKEHRRLIKCLQEHNDMLFQTATAIIAVESDAHV